jgi:hypothetical protein
MLPTKPCAPLSPPHLHGHNLFQALLVQVQASMQGTKCPHAI